MKRSRILIYSMLVLTASFVSMTFGAEQAKPTTIHQAALAGDVATVQQMLDSGTAVDAPDANQCTPLFYAVKGGSADVVRLLLQKGANPEAPCAGTTPKALAENSAQRSMEIAVLVTGTAAARGAPAPAERRGPLGRRGMPGQNAPELMPEAVTPQAAPTAADVDEAVILALLADANNVLAKAKATPEVNVPFLGPKGVEVSARSEESSWRARTTDNRATLVRAVERQFNDEMAAVKKIAEGEKATKTLSDINDLVAKRQKRYAAIYEEMRAQRQTTTAQNETTGRGRGGNMGNTMTGRGRGTMGGMPGEAAPPRPAPVRRGQDAANAGANDPAYDTQLQAWSGSNYADKRDLLATVHELDLKELELLDEAARGEKAEKTSLAIETLMVLRQQRITRIGAAMEKEDIRLQRQQNTTTGTRGGRGGMPGQQQQGMRGGRY